MNRVLILGILVVALCSLANGSITKPQRNADFESMIFVRGKWFNRNGYSNLAVQVAEPQLFQQCLDHFVQDGCQTLWNQRYWVRDDLYREGGPVFFQFGGEGPADGMIDNYYWQTYAAEYGALLVVLEHRFYGESWPTSDSDMESLKLLTSQQALADAAYFIQQYSVEHNLENSDWVAFGGSYAGNLAAWMKQKYPNVVKTAVASSGPLEAQYHFPGYMETVSAVVKELDPVCFKRTYEAFQCMENIVNGVGCEQFNDVSQILPALRQCYSVNFADQLSRESFFNSLAMGMWADNWPTALVKYNCAILNAVTGSNPLEVYGNFLVEMGQGGNCQDVSARMESNEKEVLEFIKTKEGRRAGAAGWFWQTCYEFGYYMSADPKYGLFGNETFSGLPYGSSCFYEYGSEFTTEYIETRISEVNEYYKGKDNDGSCIIFVNGEWDPWHTLSILDSSETSSNNTVVYVPKAEHCDDMLDAKTEDMQRAQDQIMTQIGLYINNPTC